ncbi:10417_t:CDS:2 [Funneliformis mosseae]|uniref:10417_t:CDS:1 n=1 Tax=Funneliformis mosseae TaxID=27381 RepID=A0A9N9GQE8_FUNMO|nr:10417_t:CDS:2 [Funneliformis mosseae]
MTERYLKNTLELPSINDFDPKRLDHFIKFNTEKILFNYTVSHYSRDYDVFCGYAGIAFTYFHLHQIDPNLNIAGDKVGLLCTTYLSAALSAVKKTKEKHVGFLGSHVGPLALAVVVYHIIENNSDEALKYLNLILKTYHPLAVKEESNELLYGRVGYLYALKFIQKHCFDNANIMQRLTDDTVKEIFELIIVEGRKGGLDSDDDEVIYDEGKNVERPPLLWSWHGKEYLGAVHGVAGIVAILLQFKNLAEPYLDDLFQTMEWLVKLAFKNGNYPLSLQSTHDDLVQVCHGAPGMVPAFLKIYELYPTHATSSTLLSAAVKSSDLIWERGILKKGLTGLCHNALGNAYSFLLLYLVNKNEEQLQRALAFGIYASQWEEETKKRHVKVPDRPWSLWEGLAGGVMFWADLSTVLKDIQVNRGLTVARDKVLGFPCFTDL